MAEQLLEIVNVAAVLEIGGGEAVAESVGCDALAESGLACGFLEGFAEGAFVQVMPSMYFGPWVCAFAERGPKPIPGPFGPCAGIFAL